MEQLTIDVDSSEVQCLPIEELSNSGINTNFAAYESQDIGSDGDHEEPQEMDNKDTHSVGRTRRGRSTMPLSDDDDFSPPASSTRKMSKPRSSSRGRTVAARTRSKSKTTNKPKNTRSRSRKSSTNRQEKAAKKPTKSRSKSRSSSKGRKPATRGRRGRM